MKGRRSRVNWTGERGLTRAEREMGNTREGRELIAQVQATPRGRIYRRDIEAINDRAAPIAADTDKTK